MIVPIKTSYYIDKSGKVLSRNDIKTADVPVTREFALAAIKALTGKDIGEALENASAWKKQQVVRSAK